MQLYIPQLSIHYMTRHWYIFSSDLFLVSSVQQTISFLQKQIKAILKKCYDLPSALKVLIFSQFKRFLWYHKENANSSLNIFQNVLKVVYICAKFHAQKLLNLKLKVRKMLSREWNSNHPNHMTTLITST